MIIKPVIAPTSALPIMCDECQMPNVVERSRGLNQWAIDLAQGGKPIP